MLRISLARSNSNVKHRVGRIAGRLPRVCEGAYPKECVEERLSVISITNRRVNRMELFDGNPSPSEQPSTRYASQLKLLN